MAQRGDGLGQKLGDVANVFALVSIAAHVGEPIRFHLQLREGALDDEAFGAILDEANLAGDTAAQGREAGSGISHGALAVKQFEKRGGFAQRRVTPEPAGNLAGKARRSRGMDAGSRENLTTDYTDFTD